MSPSNYPDEVGDRSDLGEIIYPGGVSYAASSTGPLWWMKPGYHRLKWSVRSLFSTWVRTCRKRWAPIGDQRMCCFLTIRLETT
jgi:hypothetical protein